MTHPQQNKLFREKNQLSISLYVLVPAIFAGISLLSFIVAVNVNRYLTAAKDTGLFWFVFWSIIIAAATFISGFLIISLIIRPMKTFVEKAAELPGFSTELSTKKGIASTKDELERFNTVFKEVTKILGKVESREYFPEIIGQSKAMRSLFNEILRVAPTDSTVLITGESGTGKELIANSIYDHSLRKGKPFIKLNCVAIPEGLLESELFGHEKGAFTGATAMKRGKFELANEGCLMLDEIGDMPLETQAKLLRVLQEKKFERVGSSNTITVDVRFIAASNKDLQKMVSEGKFREDLFYRLNVFHLHIPPLRDRKEDIPLLADYFLQRSNRPNVSISSLALQYLLTYHWPGNVRELENTIERMAVMTETGVIEPGHIPPNMVSQVLQEGGLKFSAVESEDEPGESIDQYLSRIERNMIIDALTATAGVQSKAARLLGIKERSLWHRIKKYEIDISPLKESVGIGGKTSNNVDIK
ncbi:MAG: sigma-54-dependent Fis family transcriptional regulator [Deltaproteobacteria bacterium]|nr:sigma-54-dependent Fis family transcriptional regulator [Deltaproteobacteria bacterium]